VRILPGIAIALVELYIGAIFGLNGPNWDWWQGVMFALAVLTLALAIGPRVRVPHGRLLAAAGAVVAVAAAVVAGERFNDSYVGTQLWPRLLACIFGAGVAAAAIGLSAAWPRSRRAAASRP